MPGGGDVGLALPVGPDERGAVGAGAQNAALDQTALAQTAVTAPTLGTTLAAGELTVVTYVAGVNANGGLADTDANPSYASWNNSTSDPQYSGADGVAHHWTATTAGQAPTIEVYFDPSSNWSAAEETAFEQGLSLWSDVANIVFQYTTSSANADYIISRAPAGR